VVFSGAGISAESGLKTFRDTGGLWEEYDINEVATPEAWQANPSLVLDFYNLRRKQVVETEPNTAHLSLVKLEEKFDVHIITQNIDDLHERAGSHAVLHLHGEVTKARSTQNHELIYRVNGDISLGDMCELGSQLRPHVVWFGESVPELENAARIVADADVLLIVGTSLNVYPAASLIHMLRDNSECVLVDPNTIENANHTKFTHIQKAASIGVPEFVDDLLKKSKPSIGIQEK